MDMTAASTPVAVSPATPATATQKLATILVSVDDVAMPSVSASSKPTPHHQTTPAAPARVTTPKIDASTQTHAHERRRSTEAMARTYLRGQTKRASPGGLGWFADN
jgi:hypothetical protein